MVIIFYCSGIFLYGPCKVATESLTDSLRDPELSQRHFQMSEKDVHF